MKLQGADTLPERSLAVQVTVVVPSANTEPGAGTQVTVAPPQLSEPVATKLTTAPHRLVSLPTVRLAGHDTVGGTGSVTITLKVQVEVLPSALIIGYTEAG